MTAFARSAPFPAVTMASVAWAVAIAIFILLRVGVVWRAPVGGAELDHLSGAWQASNGVEDSRYVSTLYQAVTALTLGWTESETPARALALAGTLTIPLALLLLRRALGEGGALLTLLLLALDPAGIAIGATATAAAWDAAIAVWLVAALVAGRPPPWAWLPIAFLAATAGPLTLPVIAGAVVVAAMRGQRPAREAVLWGALGAALGLLLASLQFGLGAEGLRIPSLHLLAVGFGEPWSGATVAQLAALYGLPLLVGGAGAGVWLIARLRRERRAPAPAEALALGMAGVAAIWFLVAMPSHSPLPLAAATLAFSFLLGPALARLADRLLDARWGEGRWLLAAALALAGIAAFALSGLAHAGGSGGNAEQALFAASLTLAAAAVAALASGRETAPLAFLPALAAGGALLVAGASGVALSAGGEPLPGPVSPASARDIRDVALEASASGGSVVVHERYREALTWPFRDSGDVVLASHAPPPGAAVLIWPIDEPAPEGFTALEGRWALERAIRGPAGFLGYVRWLTERNSLGEELELVAIYVRAP